MYLVVTCRCVQLGECIPKNRSAVQEYLCIVSNTRKGEPSNCRIWYYSWGTEMGLWDWPQSQSTENWLGGYKDREEDKDLPAVCCCVVWLFCVVFLRTSLMLQPRLALNFCLSAFSYQILPPDKKNGSKDFFDEYNNHEQ